MELIATIICLRISRSTSPVFVYKKRIGYIKKELSQPYMITVVREGTANTKVRHMGDTE